MKASCECGREIPDRWSGQNHIGPWTANERLTALGDAIYGANGDCLCPPCIYRRIVANWPEMAEPRGAA